MHDGVLRYSIFYPPIKTRFFNIRAVTWRGLRHYANETS